MPASSVVPSMSQAKHSAPTFLPGSDPFSTRLRCCPWSGVVGRGYHAALRCLFRVAGLAHVGEEGVDGQHGAAEQDRRHRCREGASGGWRSPRRA